MHNLLCDFCSSDRRFAHGLVCSPHPASFRFHLTMNTLAFGYILPTTGRIPDFHRLETCAAGRTKKEKPRTAFTRYGVSLFSSWATRIRTLKMTESESVALPFGDGPIFIKIPQSVLCRLRNLLYHIDGFRQGFFSIFCNFLNKMWNSF